PAKGTSRAGVKMRRAAAPSAVAGGRRNTVSERFISRAICCMRSSSSPRPSRNTASGLPPNTRSVNTSTCSNRYPRPDMPLILYHARQHHAPPHHHPLTPTPPHPSLSPSGNEGKPRRAKRGDQESKARRRAQATTPSPERGTGTVRAALQHEARKPRLPLPKGERAGVREGVTTRSGLL